MVAGMTPLLEIKGVHKNFGGVVALDGIDLSLPAGDLTCIIGPNGCGKTTPVSYTHLTLPTILRV